MCLGTFASCSTDGTLNSGKIQEDKKQEEKSAGRETGAVSAPATAAKEKGESQKPVPIVRPAIAAKEENGESQKTAAVRAPVTASIQRDTEYEAVTLFWGTNRAASGSLASKGQQTGTQVASRPYYGTARAKKLRLGVAEVTVPKIARPVGQVTRPRTVTFLNVALYSEKEDPRRHFTIRELHAVPRDTFLNLAREKTKDAADFEGQALIFVHGFHTSFDDALYRAAQITYDIGFDGASYVFSWPSMGTPAGYLYDRDSVDYSIKHFTEFLRMVARRTGAKKVNVLAHSTGARVVIEALMPAQERAAPLGIANLKQVILVAADADRPVFERRAQQYHSMAERLTLYANDSDAALEVSKKLSGGVPRVGGVNQGIPTIVEGSDTIDVSGATNWVFLSWHHNTYAEARHVLRDIALLMREGTRPPDKRSPITYRVVATDRGRFWKYVTN